MLTAKDVAQFFIMKGLDDEESGISNLKLQKLLYYAKGFHQAIFDEPLFPEKLWAWTYGPVVPDVYHEYKKYGRGPITELEYDPTPKLDEDQTELLNEVWSVLGQFSAWKLRDMSHNEKPWLDHERDASMIEDEELSAYFKTRVK
ncbi:MAG: Panacea domain-containing protein [Candidatus Methylumidiphilus sp.]